MDCIHCSDKTLVVDSRDRLRRRFCVGCEKRFSTIEVSRQEWDQMQVELQAARELMAAISKHQAAVSHEPESALVVAS